MERGHYVAFINVGPNLKVRKSFPIVGVLVFRIVLKFPEGDMNVACDVLFKNAGIVWYVWLFCLILGAHFLCPVENLIEFFRQMGVKWRDLSKFTLSVEKGSYFPCC